jgi:hypothetical protein
MNQKAVAREWLLFLGLLAVGAFVVLPLVAYAFGSRPIRVSEFYGTEGVFSKSDSWIAWMVVFAPYVLVQIARSVVWAATVVRR